MVALAPTHKPIGPQVVLAGLLFKLLFDVHYVYHISPSYSYMGMGLALDWYKMIESYLITFGLLMMMSWRMRVPSTMIIIIGFFTGLIPLVSVYALQGRSAFFAYMAVLTFLIILLVSWTPRVKVAWFRAPPELFISICIAFVVPVLFLLVAQGAYRHFTFDFYSVYEHRSELAVLSFFGPFKYITDWAFNVFAISLLVWALYYKQKSIGIFAIAALIFMYGSTLMKAIVFNIPFVIVTYYIIRCRGSIVGLAWLMCGVVALGMAEAWLLGQSDITALFTRRVFALPAFLAYEYYELFGNIGYVYWSNGFFGGMIPYPFLDEPPRLVGAFSLGSRETWANNGMFGMGFMQAGFFGMVLYGLIFGSWLYLIDCISVGRVPVEVAVSMMIVPTTVIFTDTDLLTGLLTHGGIAATLMLWLWGGVGRRPKHGYTQGIRLAMESRGLS